MLLYFFILRSPGRRRSRAAALEVPEEQHEVPEGDHEVPEEQHEVPEEDHEVPEDGDGVPEDLVPYGARTVVRRGAPLPGLHTLWRTLTGIATRSPRRRRSRAAALEVPEEQHEVPEEGHEVLEEQHEVPEEDHEVPEEEDGVLEDLVPYRANTVVRPRPGQFGFTWLSSTQHRLGP